MTATSTEATHMPHLLIKSSFPCLILRQQVLKDRNNIFISSIANGGNYVNKSGASRYTCMCKGDIHLNETKDGLICDKCKLLYEIRDDIPIILIDEAKPIEG